MNIHVANRKCIRHISFCSIRASGFRNLIAVFAIALTTILFTAIFTVVMSIVYGFEQSNFRQAGSYAHGCFKYLTKEQFEEIRDDPLIRQWGVRRPLGRAYSGALEKYHVELGWSDENTAKWTFLEPLQGRLPRESTNEAATDTMVLSLLGVEPKIGTNFSISIDVDGIQTTQEVTLCGFWEYDPVVPANHILLPESRVDQVLSETGAQGSDGWTGFYNLDVMFDSSLGIEQKMLTVLERHGYQTDAPYDQENYVPIGVNWGYMNLAANSEVDPMTVMAVVAVVLLIMLTGYLIIYNIFQISVTVDVRFYGLLKTIGTTGRQIRYMILLQALFLSLLGIPPGLLAGYGVGAFLTPAVLVNLNVTQSVLSVSPVIFVGSALFSLVTVIISCQKPGKMASKVSPIEALRCSEGGFETKQKERAGQEKGASIYGMAWANLNRNRKKTAITVLSLSLSIVLLNMTVTLTGGFDMEKYLNNLSVDFLFADTGYFQVGAGRQDFDRDHAVSKETAAILDAQGGIEGSGRTYGRSMPAQEFVTEDYYRQSYGKWYGTQQVEERLAGEERENGLVPIAVQLYGMEPYILDRLQVIEGDLSKLNEKRAEGEIHYIAAVYSADAEGNITEENNWAKLGDRMTIRYIDGIEIYHTISGEIYPDVESIPDAELDKVSTRLTKTRDVEYEVAALVDIPSALTYRYRVTGQDEFVMGAETFVQDSRTDQILYYAFDMEETAMEGMDAFLSDYTQNIESQYDYESRKLYADAFEEKRKMYLLCGSTLSFIIGLIGILNYLNVILTSIFARRREFAVLQSVGMTGKQLKKMLITEGELLTLGSVIISLTLTILTAPLTDKALSAAFWFFSYHFTFWPLAALAPFAAALGVLIPVLSCRAGVGKSVVERLREGE